VRPFLANLPHVNARIAVVRLCDATALLCAIPALRALRAAAPTAHITLFGNTSAAELARRFATYIDEFVDATEHDGGESESGFDIAIELQAPQSDSQLHPVTSRLAARWVAAFCNASPNGSFAGSGIRAEWPAQGPEILRLLTLIRAAGLRDQGDALEFPFHAADRSELESCREALALLGGPFVCIQPGGLAPERRWQASRFARVADALAGHGLRVALTGTKADRAVTAAVAARMRTCPIDLAGRLTNGAFAVLLDYAYLLVSNDTGVTRLAEAIGTPSVTIASGSDVPLWRPSDRVRYRVLWLPGTERPSVERLYSSWPDTSSGISVEAVLDACDVLLAEPALKQRAAVRAHLARLRHEARLTRSVGSTSRHTEAPMVRRAS
jgi:ADP-heptose:LPS heptosyltransferase